MNNISTAGWGRRGLLALELWLSECKGDVSIPYHMLKLSKNRKEFRKRFWTFYRLTNVKYGFKRFSYVHGEGQPLGLSLTLCNLNLRPWPIWMLTFSVLSYVLDPKLVDWTECCWIWLCSPLFVFSWWCRKVWWSTWLGLARRQVCWRTQRRCRKRRSQSPSSQSTKTWTRATAWKQ